MMIWELMRRAAIWRHIWVNAVFEAGDEARWPAHMRVVKAVYGW